MRSFVLATVGMTLASCRPSPPPRPAAVPPAAVWAGGVDGGSWVRCTKIEAGVYDCTVYDDYRGAVLAAGLYRLVAPVAGAESALTYSSFDGRTIYLTLGKKLVPADKQRPQ
jgi:hypothetical protein